MKKTLAGLATLALAVVAGPWSASQAAAPDTVRLYYVPGNWAQSFNGLETAFSTVFSPKATMSDEDYRGLLVQDGTPALLLSCGRGTAAVLFNEPAGRESDADHPGTMTFRAGGNRPAVTLDAVESQGAITAKLKPAKGAPPAALLSLAGLIGASDAFTLDYQRKGGGTVHYEIAPAKMTGGMTGTANRAATAASFGRACAGIATPAAGSHGAPS